MTKYDYRAWAFLMAVGILVGCGVSNINNTVGATYTAIEAAAISVKQECGNVVPGGECTSISSISTKQKNEAKDALQIAKLFADDMALIAAGGEGVHCQTTTECLQAVNHLLDSVELILVKRAE